MKKNLVHKFKDESSESEVGELGLSLEFYFSRIATHKR